VQPVTSVTGRQSLLAHAVADVTDRFGLTGAVSYICYGDKACWRTPDKVKPLLEMSLGSVTKHIRATTEPLGIKPTSRNGKRLELPANRFALLDIKRCKLDEGMCGIYQTVRTRWYGIFPSSQAKLTHLI